MAVLRELHHVMVWAVFHYSAYPKAAPLKLPFDPKLAAKAAPLTQPAGQRTFDVTRASHSATAAPTAAIARASE